MPSGEICTPDLSGLPNRTSRGMSGGNSARAGTAAVSVSTAAPIQMDNFIVRILPRVCLDIIYFRTVTSYRKLFPA